jgi:hypothetical protein
VRAVLRGGPADTVGADTAADRVELLEPVEHAHGRVDSLG